MRENKKKEGKTNNPHAPLDVCSRFPVTQQHQLSFSKHGTR